MAETAAPTRTTTPTRVQPFIEPEPQTPMDPEKICPNQKDKETRTIAPFLP